ncbi:uncharacterized protein LOC106669400 isoform X2 [Cimex lectularius]|nr:uncharacterized protein LOC106669400 isoform X2 [Cimex lectularius]XP_014254349.1 uncharacterized protein LOC106669400 isoform X2 [Cimex lectularius]
MSTDESSNVKKRFKSKSKKSSYDRSYSTSSEGTKDKKRKESTRGKSISPQSETYSSEADGGDNNETSVNSSSVWEKRGRSRTPRKLTITNNSDENCDISSITTGKKPSADRKSITTAELTSDGCNAGDNHEIKREFSIHKSRSASLNVKKASEVNKPTLTETTYNILRDVSPKFVYKEKVQRQNTIQPPVHKGVPEPLITSNIIVEVGNDTSSQRLIWEHEPQPKSTCNKGTIKIDFENNGRIPDYKLSKGKSRKPKAFASSRPFGGLSSEPAPSEIEVGKNACSSKRVRSKSGSKKRKVRSTSPPKKAVGAKNVKPPAGVNTTTLVKKVVTSKKPDTHLDNTQPALKSLINATKGVNPSAQINTNTPYTESDARNKLGPCGTLNDYDGINKANPRAGVGMNIFAEKDAGKKTGFSEGNRPATYMKRDNTLLSGGLRSNPLQNDYGAVKKTNPARGGAGVTSTNICGDNGAGMKIEPDGGICTTTAYSKRDDTGPRGEVRSKPIHNEYGTGKKANPCGGVGTTISGEQDAGKKIGPCAGIRTTTAYTKRDDTGPCGEVRSNPLYNEYGTGRKANPCGGVGTTICGEKDSRKINWPCGGNLPSTTYVKNEGAFPCGTARANSLLRGYDITTKANPCAGINKKSL